jgi:hypothetical protein
MSRAGFDQARSVVPRSQVGRLDPIQALSPSTLTHMGTMLSIQHRIWYSAGENQSQLSLSYSKTEELAKLVTDSRTFMSQIAKAKTARLSESERFTQSVSSPRAYLDLFAAWKDARADPSSYAHRLLPSVIS